MLASQLKMMNDLVDEIYIRMMDAAAEEPELTQTLGITKRKGSKVIEVYFTRKPTVKAVSFYDPNKEVEYKRIERWLETALGDKLIEMEEQGEPMPCMEERLGVLDEAFADWHDYERYKYM